MPRDEASLIPQVISAKQVIREITAEDLQPRDKRALLSRDVTTPKKVTKAHIDSIFIAEVPTAFVKITEKLTGGLFTSESDL